MVAPAVAAGDPRGPDVRVEVVRLKLGRHGLRVARARSADLLEDGQHLVIKVELIL